MVMEIYKMAIFTKYLDRKAVINFKLNIMVHLSLAQEV